MTRADLSRPLQIPATLEAKFTQLLSRYPVKRSALIPMMMYAQDYYGFVGDDVIAEIARRLDLNTTQVTETMAYYSMLRRKPAGKYHIQVCTNVSCMLRGGNEIARAFEEALEIGHKEITPSGMFSLEEVECMGACTGAPCLQVNYDFYEDLTPILADELLEQLQTGMKTKPVSCITGSLHERHEIEVPVISRRFGITEFAQDWKSIASTTATRRWKKR